MSVFFDALLWANLQAAIVGAVVLPPAVGAALLLRRRLPVWRKGLWLGVLAVPFLWLALILLLPAQGGSLLPSAWLGAVSPVGASLAPYQRAVGRVAAIAYLVWLAVVVVMELLMSLRLRAMLRDARAVQHPGTVALYHELVQALRCWSAPRLVQTSQAASPFIAPGPGRATTIVLPEALAGGDGDPRALRAVLAHELAHARAGDPATRRCLLILRCIFPLPWLSGLAAARAFWEDAAEETTDLRALCASGLSGSAYADVLKDFALAGGAVAARPAMSFQPAAGELSGGARFLAHHLIARLRGLGMAARWSELQVMGMGACLRAGVAILVLTVLAHRSVLAGLLNDAAIAPPAVEAAVAPPRPAPIVAVEAQSPDAIDLERFGAAVPPQAHLEDVGSAAHRPHPAQQP